MARHEGTGGAPRSFDDRLLFGSVVATTLIVLVGAAAIVLVLPEVWRWYGEAVESDPALLATAKDNLRERMFQLLALGAVAGGLLQYRGHVLERVSNDYRTALELLSSDDSWTRVAGVHSLGGTAWRHPEYRERTADVLAALVRDKSRRRMDLKSLEALPPKDGPGGKRRPDPDVQAALFVLASKTGPGTDRHGGHTISLSDVMIDGVNLRNGHLPDVAFRRSVLRDARAEDAMLSDSEFRDAVLSKAHFARADLTSAKFRKASLDEAEFTDAVLYGADFTDADLRNAKFTGAHLYKATGWRSEETKGNPPHCDPDRAFEPSCLPKRPWHQRQRRRH